MKVTATLECSALGKVAVVDGTMVESLDAPTVARVHVVAEAAVDAEGALGKPATLSFAADGASRKASLVVTGVEALDLDTASHAYVVELQHPLALLRLRRDVRTFLSKTTKQIVEAVFTAAKLGTSDLTWSASRGKSAPREWCVQYNETDFAFVSRLLEEEGIFYFCPDDAAPKLTLADAPSAFETIGGNGEVPLSFEGGGMGVDELSIEHAVTSDAVALADYAFETPGVDLTSRTKLADDPAGETFEYPGRYATQDEGRALAKIRAEELASGKVTATGTSNRAAFAAGRWFVLTSTRDDAPTGKYLLRRVEHRFGGEAYRNTFVASPFDLPYRPARVTPRPSLEGAFSVTVSGAAGQEIETDKYGRMKGLFAFDRLGKPDDTASPWIRVLQPPLGGSMMLARIGWEMAVRHLDGDPDRPVAVARMYDGEHVPPETLPATQTKTSFETLSSPRAEKVNAITIDDKGGAMMFEIKAAKDLDATIVHDETETVGANDTLEVGQDDTQLVGDKQAVTIEKDDSAKAEKDAGVEIAGDRTKKIAKDETVTVEGGASMRVDGKIEETVGADLTIEAEKELLETAKGKLEATIGGAVTSKAGKDYVVYVAGKSSETVAGAKTVSSSDGALTEATGGNVTVTIGGACSETAQGNRVASAGGDVEKTIGAVSSLTAAGKLQIKAKTIKIQVSAAANFVGAGGILSVTPASVGFVGLVTFKGSGGVEIAGAPQMAG
jgi:type VI secretion system secreted protein VgrG